MIHTGLAPAAAGGIGHKGQREESLGNPHYVCKDGLLSARCVIVDMGGSSSRENVHRVGSIQGITMSFV
jgi:hypothetical protein